MKNIEHQKPMQVIFKNLILTIQNENELEEFEQELNYLCNKYAGLDYAYTFYSE